MSLYRWGDLTVFPWFSTVREILDFMFYLLKVGLD
jgi:hypothetical protein